MTDLDVPVRGDLQPSGDLLSVIGETLAPTAASRAAGSRAGGTLAPPLPGRSTPSRRPAPSPRPPTPAPPTRHAVPLPHTAADAPVPAPGDNSAPWWLGLAVTLEATMAVALTLWRAGDTPLDPYYAAAVRSMAGSWHDFLFGSFDPAGSVTMDKLPVAFWPQALLVRLLGFHQWTMVLPQVLEGAVAVVVLVAAVRRLADWRAGLIAGAVLAASPAAVLLDRGTMPDTLMTLMLVLAADQVTRAVARPDRWMPVVACGLLVGLAFEAKMTEAWLALPGMALALLLAGAPRHRLRQLAVGGAVMVVVSLAWMAAVSVVPAQARPYVDGSTHDSPFEQVFLYNGTDRFGGQSATALQDVGMGPANPPGATRLLTGPDGTVTGWLLPPAALVAVGGLLRRHRGRRADPCRSALVLWGGWLLAYWLAFSAGTAVLPYYAGAMAPAVAALCGIGVAALWSARHRTSARVAGLVVAAVTAGTAAWLLPASGVGLAHWGSLGLTVTAAACVAGAALASGLAGLAGHPGRRRWAAVAVVLAALAGTVVPAAAAVDAAGQHLGPFDTPFEPARAAALTHVLLRIPELLHPAISLLQRVEPPGSYLVTTDTAILASEFIDATGEEAYPIGGATGRSPAPTLARLRALVAEGRVRVVVAGPSTDPRLEWVRHACVHVPVRIGATGSQKADSLLDAVSVYVCSPASARSGG